MATANNPNNPIAFDPQLMPPHVQERFFASALSFEKEALRQPGGREMIDAETAARKERMAAQKAAQEGR